jgi:hypothetical protein
LRKASPEYNQRAIEHESSCGDCGEVKDLRSEFSAFKEMVNGKLQAIDFEIAKLMYRPK